MIWKIIGGIGIVVGLISGLIAIDSRYATSKDLHNVETKLVMNLDQFSKEQSRQFKIQRYDQATDNYYRYKALEKMHPNDPMIKEDLKRIEDERNRLKDELNTIK
jgi:hypothetical protein